MDSEKKMVAIEKCVCGIHHDKQGIEHCLAAHVSAVSQLKIAIKEIHKAFGNPGNYGYSSKEGIALKQLYDAYNAVLH